MKTIALLLLIASSLLLVNTCWHGSHFCPHKIASSLPFREEWETDPPTKEIEAAWNQPYTYLGNGAQSYAFVSADGKYVLKFFKMKHLIPKRWLKAIPGLEHYRTQKLTGREKRLNQTFGAFKMAYEEFRNESGLLFVHLNHTNSLKKQITLHQKEKTWKVDLDRVPFVLQEKAELIYDHFHRLLAIEDRDSVQQHAASVLTFFKEREAKGFIDLDPGVSGNFGFVDHKVIQIDIGRLQRRTEILREEEEAAKRAEQKFLLWLQQHP